MLVQSHVRFGVRFGVFFHKNPQKQPDAKVLSLQTIAISVIKYKHTGNICYTGKLYFSNKFSLHIWFFFTQKVKPHTCSKMHSVLYDTVTTCTAHGTI